jgi:hypothetical protein
MKKIKIGDCYMISSEVAIVTEILEIARMAQSVNAETGKSRIPIGLQTVERFLIPTLHLPIGNNPKKYGGAWFDRNLSGEKKEEYREIVGEKKSCKNVGLLTDCKAALASYEVRNFGNVYFEKLLKSGQFNLKPWKVLHLTNGYGHDKPQLWAHIESISIGRGNPEWGAPADRDVFIIHLGDVFHTKNLKPQ